MKQKIGIITYFNAFNYGGDLQCFALQCKLRNIGYNAEVLNVRRPCDKDFKYDNAKKFKSLYSFNEKRDIKAKVKTNIYHFIMKIISLIYRKKSKERERVFKEFYKKYIVFSEDIYYNYTQLYDSADKLEYTHYITGSDQVWNYQSEYSIEPYMLTFVKKGKKISYAASIGHSEIPEELKQLYKHNLSDFSNISLREEIGVDLIKKITGRDDIEQVLDPTFLLTKNEWLKALNLDSNKQSNQEDREKYVLVYLLSRSNFSLKIACNLAEKLNYKVKVINSSIYNLHSNKKCEYILAQSPREFVRLFSNASFVITNSFHGTAFSLNFNIPFISTTRKNKRVNSRFISILSKLSLIDRLVYEDEEFEIGKYLSLNFEHAKFALDLERDKSINYLVNSLN
ncbi:MAG: polysaccharide pyruvyl transferase family protein [Bacteroidales bacterium]|jgi:hypothetical protein